MKNNKLIFNLGTYILLPLFLIVIFKGLVKDNNGLYMIALVIIHIITLLVLFLYNKYEILEMFDNFKKKTFKNIKKDFIIWIIGFILMIIVNYVLVYIIFDSIPENEQMVRAYYDKYLIYSVITNIILVPFLEEFVFRLGFNRINNKYIFIGISSIIFAGFHALESIKVALDILYILPYLILGITFAHIYYRSENVFNSIVIHAWHNFIVLILYFIL